MAARAVNDPDLWWHLRTGQLIVQNHSVFHRDPYSFTRFGQPWMNHEWLSEVLIYGLYSTAGWAGLSVVFGAITAAAFVLVFLRCPGRPYIAAIITLWGAFASAPTWGVRPQTLSLLLASIFLLILEKASEHPRFLWWIVPLTVLWVNLHAEYALGIALLMLFLAGSALDVAFGFEDRAHAAPRLRTLLTVTAVCVALVPLNPNGLRMYWYPLETLQSRAMQSYIDEWSSPNFHDPKHLPLLFMLLAILGAMAVSPRRMRPRELLLLSVMTWAALHSIRHVGIFALVAVPILSGLVYGWLEERGLALPLQPAPQGLAHKKLLLNALLLSAFVAFTVLRVRYMLERQAEIEAQNFPAAAVSYLSARRPPGPILNHYNWGGYFIWKLYPEYQVYIDGRADLYGDAFLDDRAATYYLRTSHWKEPIEGWRIRTVVLPPEAPLVTALRSKPEWNQIYADAHAVILTRSPW